MSHWAQVERTFTVDRNRLFRAWTDPVELAAWIASPGWRTSEDAIVIDPRTGGGVTLTLTNESTGQQQTVQQKYTDVVAGERICSTEVTAEDSPTRTREVVFSDAAAGSKLAVRLGPFDSAQDADAVTRWWTATLERLAAFVRPPR